MNKANKIHCPECPYFTEVIYEGEYWYGARCEKDGHEANPSMYAIKLLHDDCPLTVGGEKVWQVKR